jgi:MFS family permease
VLGSIAAGMLAAAYGWRMMFVICGAAGFVLVLLMLPTMREPARAEPHLPGEPATLGASIAHLARLPGFTLLSVGMGLGSMIGGVLPVWAPAFLLRSHGVALADVGALIGPAVGIGGVTGAIVMGIVAGHMVRRRGSEVHALLVPLVAMPLAMPFYGVFIFAPSVGMAMMAAAIMNFLLASGFAPCISAAVSLAPSRMRAVASTVMFTASGVIGGAFAPLVVGVASDMATPSLGGESLRYGLATMAVAPLLSWGVLWAAYRRALRGVPAPQ